MTRQDHVGTCRSPHGLGPAIPASSEDLVLDLGGGASLALAPVPAVSSGQTAGTARPPAPLWIGRYEVTNAQFRRFRPSHDSGYYNKRLDRHDGKGLTLNRDEAITSMAMTGGDFYFLSPMNLRIGVDGYGEMLLSGGSAVTCSGNSALNIGHNAGSLGVLDILHMIPG